MMSMRFICAISWCLSLPWTLCADANLRVETNKTGGVTIVRPTLEAPLLVYHAPEDGRPYLHPLLAPDGKGILTEDSPGHHKHQTGIFVGFLKVNGRDYFHHRGPDHFRRMAFTHEENSQGVHWHSTYELLDGQKASLLIEEQHWHFRDFGKTYLMDLSWKATASVDLTFDRSDYGGLFIRMPFHNQPGSQAINSEGEINAKAEGQRARWVDIGIPIEGRKDQAHIAVMAHASNPRAPLPWRVDGQLGVGPSPARLGAWKLSRGEKVTHRYRFLVYTGELQQSHVEAQWKAFCSLK